MGDHQGSTRVVMNATGANGGIVSRHDYLPFGEDCQHDFRVDPVTSAKS
jgi:hypothetical protein